MVKRPSDAELIFSVLNVLRKSGEIVGEIRFLEALKKMNIGASPKRFRRLIYSIPEIEVSVRYTKKKFDHLDKCPVWSSKLSKIREINLEGKRKIIGYKCNLCGYNSTSHGKPYIYAFRLKNHDL